MDTKLFNPTTSPLLRPYNISRHIRSFHPSPNHCNQNPSYPKLSLSNLGANRTVKITLYTVLGILGTAETVFYYKAGMRWYYGESKEKVVEEA